MRKTRQLSFSGPFIQKSLAFGGNLLKKSNAKSKRPISHKNSMHLVFRSTQAKGNKSFLNSQNAKRIKAIIQNQAKTTRIQIHEFANVGNHIHLLIKIKAGNHFQARQQLQKFFRAVTGLIARHVLKAERGPSVGKIPIQMKTTKFWDQRPFTRVVIGSRGYRFAKDYVVQNTLEALGIIPYQPRKFALSNSS